MLFCPTMLRNDSSVLMIQVPHNFESYPLIHESCLIPLSPNTTLGVSAESPLPGRRSAVQWHVSNPLLSVTSSRIQFGGNKWTSSETQLVSC